MRAFLITDEKVALANGESVTDAAKRCLDIFPPGILSLQLREKQKSESDLLKMAIALRTICKPKNVPLFINSNIKVAVEAQAKGVHFPESTKDDQVESAKKLGLRIGMSCHNLEALKKAQHLQVDYIYWGPIFETKSKKSYGAPLGPTSIKQARRLFTYGPVFAIGGIDTTKKVQAAAENGATGIAGIGIFAASKAAAARQIAAVLPKLPCDLTPSQGITSP